MGFLKDIWYDTDETIFHKLKEWVIIISITVLSYIILANGLISIITLLYLSYWFQYGKYKKAAKDGLRKLNENIKKVPIRSHLVWRRKKCI